MQAQTKERLGSLLKSEIQRSAELRIFHRLHCVLMVEHGYACQDVAACFGHDPSTVARWVRRVEALGPEGLREEAKSGRPPKLTTDQIHGLSQDLNGPPAACGYENATWDGKVLASHIEARCGVRLSVRQCQRLLRQLRRRVSD